MASKGVQTMISIRPGDAAMSRKHLCPHDLNGARLAEKPLAGRLWWLLPPAAALFYPLAVKALYESGQLLHSASGWVDLLAWLAIVVSIGLVYSVPAVGIAVAYLLGRHERISTSELVARRVAHFAVASPPLFVLIGVVFHLVHAADGDSWFWTILWLSVLAATAWAMRKR